MKIEAYADTKNGCHICLACVTEQEKETLTPLYHSDLWDYTYADWDLGHSNRPNYPSCDRCLEEIEFQDLVSKGKTLVSIMGKRLARASAKDIEDIDMFQEGFTQYSEWTNMYLPTFRMLSGYNPKDILLYAKQMKFYQEIFNEVENLE